MAEIIYVLTNAETPTAIKIGLTDREDVSERMKQLYTTGVIVPFDCAYACTVENNAVVEKLMHDFFNDKRINPKREFFRMPAKTPIQKLKTYEIKDMTPQLRDIADTPLLGEEKQVRWEVRTALEKKNPEWKELKDLHKALK